MSDGVIGQILSDLRTGRFIVTTHAHQRMQERSVSRRDIIEVGFNCESYAEQDNGNFRLLGKDLDGDDLEVVVAFDGDTVIVTVMG